MRLLERKQSCGIDYRTTFLRWHMPAELRRAEKDILALTELKERFRELRVSVDDSRLSSHINAVTFFYREKPEQRLYIPVRVFDTKSHKEFASLTSLIAATRESPHGILLESRSGAGKTVACWKAFYDCLLAADPTKIETDPVNDESAPVNADPDSRPLLAGWLPCWVRLGGIPSGLSGRALIEFLILRSAGFDERQFRVTQNRHLEDSHIRFWLNYSPPLLLFFDLNRADSTDRERIADACLEFQAEYRNQSHRCVVTYRSTNEEDPVLQLLKESIDTPFRSYDLRPLGIPEARGYLRSLRNYEAELREKFALPELPPESIDEDCAKLEELTERHARGRESIISTPLLMHFVSSLDSENLQSIDTLWDLYGHVVDRHLKRDAGYTKAMSRRLRDARKRRTILMTAMPRLAMAVLAHGATSVRLDTPDVEALLQDPKDEHSGWQPAASFWKNASYFTEGYESDMIGEILEFSLVRTDSQGVGFLHDSFLYYFAAYALRHYRGPDRPSMKAKLPDNWFREVVERIRENPEAWKLSADFLGGALVAKSPAPSGKP